MTEASQDAHDGQETVDKDALIRELREAVRARDDFVSVAAHELRNPMTPILMQVHNLSTAVRDPARCRADVLGPRLELLEFAVRDFIRRSTALLDVSRLAAGHASIEASEMDISRLVREVVGRAQLAAQMAKSPLSLELEEGVIGFWDRLALEQVCENLLSNALKFGAGKPVRVTLRSVGPDAVLTVRDHGIGISADDLARIFQRFERAVARREHGGFGVGLWLANQLVTAMGGRIAVESKPGEGTSFIVDCHVQGSRRTHDRG